MNDLDERGGYWHPHPHTHSHPHSHPYATGVYGSPPTPSFSVATSPQVQMPPPPPPPGGSPPGRSTPSGGTPTPSSRRALTYALELAQIAVRLDAQNDDPQNAIYAYARAVSLLNHVMTSVMRGDDDNYRRRNSSRRRPSVSARQDEINRLRDIHDTYANRMQILSEIYSIPVIQLSPEEAFNGTQPGSAHANDPEFTDGVEHIGSAMLDTATANSPLNMRHDRIGLGFQQSVVAPHPITESGRLSPSPTTPTPLNNHHPQPHVPAPASYRASVANVPPPRPPPSGPLPSRPADLPTPAPPPSGPLPLPPLPPPPQQQQQQQQQPAYATLDQIPTSHWDGSTRSRAQTGASIASSAVSSATESVYDDSDPGRTVSRARNQLAMALGSLNDQIDVSTHPRQVSAQPMQTATTTAVGRSSPPLPPVPQDSWDHSRASTTHAGAGSQSASRQGDAPGAYPIQRPSSGSSRPRSRSGSVRAEMPPPLPPINGTPSGSVSSRRGTKPPPLPMSFTNTNGSHATSSRAPTPTALPSSSSPSSTEHLPAGAAPYNTIIPPSLPAVRIPVVPTNSVAVQGPRSRALSQPGRPPLPGHSQSFHVEPTNGHTVPPRTSMTPPAGIVTTTGRKLSYASSHLATPGAQVQTGSLAGSFPAYLSHPCMPQSALPPPPPTDAMLKPFSIMAALRQSMTSKTGAYLTRRLHVPYETWTAPAGLAKLLVIGEKSIVASRVASALNDVTRASEEFCGFGPGSGAEPDEADFQRWITALGAWESFCEAISTESGKKLGVGEGFVTKKTGGWSNKLSRGLEKMTSTGKNVESSAASYITNLSQLFANAQTLERHAKWFLATPRSDPYKALSESTARQLGDKLRRSSEFFAKFVLPFVIRDVAQLLDRHAKHGERWLSN